VHTPVLDPFASFEPSNNSILEPCRDDCQQQSNCISDSPLAASVLDPCSTGATRGHASAAVPFPVSVLSVWPLPDARPGLPLHHRSLASPHPSSGLSPAPHTTTSTGHRGCTYPPSSALHRRRRLSTSRKAVYDLPTATLLHGSPESHPLLQLFPLRICCPDHSPAVIRLLLARRRRSLSPPERSHHRALTAA
jgi:hypothetical protein